MENLTQIQIKTEYLWLIQNGLKTVEGRKNSPTWKHLRKGVFIRFYSNETNETLKARIVRVTEYFNNEEGDALYNYLIHEGLRNVLPNVKTYQEARNIYLNFWSIEDIQKYGMIAIQIELIHF